MKSGGRLIVECLEAQGVERVFCVPGESYLALLDALYDSPIETVVCRQEGGAAMMAEAVGKLTGRPGVVMVTRGPGAANACAGIHVAQQDSTPMILFVGQIGRDMRGRDAFQEVDYRHFFGDMTKWVAEIDSAERIPEMLSRAFHVAMSGRPGPVVLALPEEMLQEAVKSSPGRRVEPADPAPTPQQISSLKELLAAAKKPFVIAAGSRWESGAVVLLQRFSECWRLPVGCSFRRQMLFDHEHPHYAGDIGLGINPALKRRISEADLLLLVGGRFSENPSQKFSLLNIPSPSQKLVHVHPGAEELGRIYHPDLAINATAGEFLKALQALVPPTIPTWSGVAEAAHADYLEWSGEIPATPGKLQMREVMRWLEEHLDEDAVITNGAGNYATWVHRFHRYRRFGSQLAPTSGSMGYGLPAAIAAKLTYPRRQVICFAGDGCFQMTMQEFGTALQCGANIIVLLIDNGIYGTIRMHQEREYPGRVSATTLVNPDFAALANSYGGYGECVEETGDFAAAFARAMASRRPAILHLKLDPEAISPTTTLSRIRSMAMSPHPDTN